MITMFLKLTQMDVQGVGLRSGVASDQAQNIYKSRDKWDCYCEMRQQDKNEHQIAEICLFIIETLQ